MRTSAFQKLNSFSSLPLPDQEGADLEAISNLANKTENPLSSKGTFDTPDTSGVG